MFQPDLSMFFELAVVHQVACVSNNKWTFNKCMHYGAGLTKRALKNSELSFLPAIHLPVEWYSAFAMLRLAWSAAMRKRENPSVTSCFALFCYNIYMCFRPSCLANRTPPTAVRAQKRSRLAFENDLGLRAGRVAIGHTTYQPSLCEYITAPPVCVCDSQAKCIDTQRLLSHIRYLAVVYVLQDILVTYGGRGVCCRVGVLAETIRCTYWYIF